MTIFGTIITGADVENAVEETIRLWQLDYLAEVAQQSGEARGALPPFRSFPRLVDLSKWEEDQTPSCVISAPGTIANPEVRQQAANVRWGVGIGCIVSAKDEQTTLRLSQLYAAAVRAMILQHRSLGGFSSGVNWISERYDNLDTTAARTLASGVVQFGVDVFGTVDLSQGPMTPSADATLPPGDWPEIETVNTSVERIS